MNIAGELSTCVTARGFLSLPSKSQMDRGSDVGAAAELFCIHPIQNALTAKINLRLILFSIKAKSELFLAAAIVS